MKHQYYRMSLWLNKGAPALDTWYNHQKDIGVPVARVQVDKDKGTSIWVIGVESLGPKGSGNKELLDKACIVKEANGFSEAMGG